MPSTIWAQLLGTTRIAYGLYCQLESKNREHVTKQRQHRILALVNVIIVSERILGFEVKSASETQLHILAIEVSEWSPICLKFIEDRTIGVNLQLVGETKHYRG
jgi:hypothetical protein